MCICVRACVSLCDSKTAIRLFTLPKILNESMGHQKLPSDRFSAARKDSRTIESEAGDVDSKLLVWTTAAVRTAAVVDRSAPCWQHRFLIRLAQPSDSCCSVVRGGETTKTRWHRDLKEASCKQRLMDERVGITAPRRGS